MPVEKNIAAEEIIAETINELNTLPNLQVNEENYQLTIDAKNRLDDERLKQFLKSYHLDKPLIIQFTKPYLKVTHFAQALLAFLIAEKINCCIYLQDSDDVLNKDAALASRQLLSYHRYLNRKRQAPENRQLAVLLEKPVIEPKIRRHKLMMKRQERLGKHTQQQFHRQNEQHVEKNQQQARQRNQQVGQQRQAQRQQYKARQQLIARQQARAQHVEQQNQAEKLIGSPNDLINRNNLHRLVNEEFTLEKLQVIWDRLVGQYAKYAEDENNRITHVPLATLKLIIQHDDKFSGGIHFDDLPNGFGFAVLNVVIDNQDVRASVLYYSKSLEKVGKQRQDSLLAPQLIPPLAPILDFGDVGQFFSFMNDELQNYERFCQQYQPLFDYLFYPTGQVSLEQRQHALIELLCIDNKQLLAMKPQLSTWLSAFTNNNINGLRTVFITAGADATVQLLYQLQQLKNTNQYELFKAQFLDKSADWRHLIRENTSHPDELTGLKALEYLGNMSATERVWWQAVSAQHCQNNQHVDVIDLINGHRHFFRQVEDIDNKLNLPCPCPVKNIINMKASYNFILAVLRKAVDPFEQVKHLNQNWSMQGAVYASRAANYVFVHEDMYLTPERGIADWERYRDFIPELKHKFINDDRAVYYIERADLQAKRDKFIELYKSYIQKSTANFEIFIPPNDFFSNIYEPKLPLMTRILPFELSIKYTLRFLTRNDQGEIIIQSINEYRNKAAFAYELLGTEDLDVETIGVIAYNPGSYWLINSEQLRDEPWMTCKNKLNYQVDLPRLYELSKKLSIYENICRYFYRFIGTQPYAFSFDTYQKMMALFNYDASPQLVHQILNEGNYSGLRVRLDVILKDLMPILAATTTGKRALKANENHQLLLEQLIIFRYNNRHLAKRPRISSENQPLKVYSTYFKPTLSFFGNENDIVVKFQSNHNHKVTWYYIDYGEITKLNNAAADHLKNLLYYKTYIKKRRLEHSSVLILSTPMEKQTFKQFLGRNHQDSDLPDEPIKIYQVDQVDREINWVPNGSYFYNEYHKKLSYVENNVVQRIEVDNHTLFLEFIKTLRNSSTRYLCEILPLDDAMEFRKSENSKSLFNILNEHLAKASIQPLLSEIISILKLPINERILNDIFIAVNDLDTPFIYQALTNIQQRELNIKTKLLSLYCSRLVWVSRKFPFPDSKHLILLSSLVESLEQGEALLFNHERLINSINLEVLDYLNKILSKVNVTASKHFPTHQDVDLLLTELAKIPSNEPHKKACVYAAVQQILPGLKIADAQIADALVLLIRSLAPLGWTLKELTAFVQQQDFKQLDRQDEQETVIGEQTNKHFLLKIADGLKDAVLERINSICDSLIAAENNLTEENVSDVLRGIQGLIELIEKPFDFVDTKNFSAGDKLKFIAVKVMLTPVILLIKNKIVSELKNHLHSVYSLQLANTVEALHINDDVLNQEQEKDILLSSQLATFFIQQLPPLPGKDITFEMNHFFKLNETFDKVLKNLKYWPNRTKRDLFIRELYRLGYFNRKPLHPSLNDLDEIIVSIRSFNQLDILPLLPSLLALNINMEMVKFLLEHIVKHQANLTQHDVQQIIDLALRSPQYGNQIVASLLNINTILQPSRQAKTVRALLLRACQQADQMEGLSSQLADFNAFVQDHANQLEPITALIQYAAAEPNPLFEYLQAFTKVLANKQYAAGLLIILTHGCWQHATEKRWSLDEQLHFIQLFQNVPVHHQAALMKLYQAKPAPSLSSLQKALVEERLEAWLTEIEIDPFGNIEKITQQLSIKGVESFVNGIKALPHQEVIAGNRRASLLDGYSYIVAITDKYCLATSSGKLKPLKNFSRDELREYYLQCVKRTQQAPNAITPKLEALAIFCLAMFRTTGKYPYFSQTVSALTTILFNGNLMQQIPTGQGKGITNALIAALSFSFGGAHVTVTSRFQYLVERDFKENRDFFEYLHIPVQLISPGTEENYFITPAVKYSTSGGESLYRSKLKEVDQFVFPLAAQQTWIGDEGDCDIYDNKNAFNFSESDEDPYFNPLEWAYPLVNDFIDSALFESEAVMEAEDIYFLRAYLQDKAPEAFEAYRDRLTAAKLDQLINAACTAKTLIENEDYIIRQKTRTVYGRQQTISQAHVLVNHAEDTEATLSYGVQQCLHARLSIKYAEQIDNWKKRLAHVDKMPPFPCDNQIDSIDSQHYYSYLMQFGRRIATTGTAGAQVELFEARNALHFEHILSIPPRRPGLLRYLDTLFTNEKASFYFSPNTQIEAIKRIVAKAEHQPVLINSQSIEKAEFYKTELEKKYPGQVQVIHAKVAENEDVFANLVAKAKDPGMITIITPLAARGADIKPEKGIINHPNPSRKAQKIADLAEVLLTVETYLERYRERMQFQGRTARDQRPGETIGVFDLADIEQTHGVDLRPYTREEKLAFLDKLMQRLDSEAAMERIVSTQAKQLAVDYTNQLDDYLINQPDKRREILAAKARFIEEADTQWSICLAASDPNNQYPNPYIRYDGQGQLTDRDLLLCIQKYEAHLKDCFKKCCELMNLDMPFAAVQKSYSYRFNQAKDHINIEDNKLLVVAILPATVYIEHQINEEKNQKNGYLTEVNLTEKFRRHLIKWFDKDLMSTQVKETAFLFQQEIDKKLQNAEACFPVSYLQTLSQWAEDPNVELSVLMNLANFSALAAQDAYFEVYQQQTIKSWDKLTSKQQALLIEASQKFLIKVLNKSITSKLFNDLEKTTLRYLNQLLTKLQFENTQECQSIILSVLAIIQRHFTDSKLPNFLHGLKAVIDVALLRKSETEKMSQDNKQIQSLGNQFELIRSEITFFLEQTRLRLDKPAYRLLHRFAQKKIDSISEFLEQLNQAEVKEQFIKENISSFNKDELLEAFSHFKINERCLNDILSFNTFDGTRHSQTKSRGEFNQLNRHWQHVHGVKNYEAYLETLQTIGKQLIQRQKTTGFFKDQNLYTKKVAKFNDYYQQIEQLIRNKETNQIQDIDSEIMTFQLRIQHDPDLAINTSRLLKLPSRVTLVKEMTEATRQYLLS